MMTYRAGWVFAFVFLCSSRCLAQEVPSASEGASAKVPAGCRIKGRGEPEPYTGTGYAKLVVHQKTGIDMVFIPAGTFMMGASVEDKGNWIGEKPQHQVTIGKPFYMGRYEVTVEEFKKFFQETKYKTDIEKKSEKEKAAEPTWMAPGFPQTDRHPAVCMSWNDAKAFCRWAGLRLPTESEWEFACRAGTSTVYGFGNDKAGLKDYGWYQIDDTQIGTHPVGDKKPNAWNLFDMVGNAFEWVEDPWHDGYERAPTDGSVWLDRADETKHVVRGGSWYHVAEHSRSAHRMWYFTQQGVEVLGFRPVLGVE